MYQSSPATSTLSPLEAKTLLYWTLQMHWNNKTHVLLERNPFAKHPNVQEAISDCNVIMSDLDPKRALSQLAFKLQSAIISKPDPLPVRRAKEVALFNAPANLQA